MSEYGECDRCNCELMPTDWFEDIEYDSHMIPTGRVRLAVGYMICPECGKKYCVDDSFDGPWHYKDQGRN